MLLCYNWYVFNQGRRFLCHELMRSHQMSAWSTLKHLNAFPGCASPSPSPRLPSLPPHLSFVCLHPSYFSRLIVRLLSSRLCLGIHLMRLRYIRVNCLSGDSFYISLFLALSRSTHACLSPNRTNPTPPPTPTTLSVEMKPNGSVGSRMQRGQCEFAVLACR